MAAGGGSHDRIRAPHRRRPGARAHLRIRQRANLSIAHRAHHQSVPPGGTSDILARTLAEKLALEWGQPVIAENRPGAAGNIATEYVAKQRGDPHVLLINTVGTHAINPAIYPNLPFDPIKDFTLITNLVNLPSLLIVHPSYRRRTRRS